MKETKKSSNLCKHFTVAYEADINRKLPKMNYVIHLQAKLKTINTALKEKKILPIKFKLFGFKMDNNKLTSDIVIELSKYHRE